MAKKQPIRRESKILRHVTFMTRSKAPIWQRAAGLALTEAKFWQHYKAIMSRGLGRIERAILALIEDKRARKNGYAAEALAVAAYQPGTKSKRPPTKAERVAVARAMRSLAHKYHDRIVLKGGDDRPLWLERR
jgi:hypothetical protein